MSVFPQVTFLSVILEKHKVSSLILTAIKRFIISPCPNPIQVLLVTWYKIEICYFQYRISWIIFETESLFNALFYNWTISLPRIIYLRCMSTVYTFSKSIIRIFPYRESSKVRLKISSDLFHWLIKNISPISSFVSLHQHKQIISIVYLVYSIYRWSSWLRMLCTLSSSKSKLVNCTGDWVRFQNLFSINLFNRY